MLEPSSIHVHEFTHLFLFLPPPCSCSYYLSPGPLLQPPPFSPLSPTLHSPLSGHSVGFLNCTFNHRPFLIRALPWAFHGTHSKIQTSAHKPCRVYPQPLLQLPLYPGPLVGEEPSIGSSPPFLDAEMHPHPSTRLMFSAVQFLKRFEKPLGKFWGYRIHFISHWL